MKRVAQSLIMIEIILLFLLGTIISTIYVENKVLYGQTHSFTILSPYKNEQLAAIPLEEKTATLHQIAQACHVNLTKIVWHSDKDLAIYTNFPEKFGLTQNSFTKRKEQNFFSNVPTSSANQIGLFKWPDNRQTVRLYSLAGLNHAGIDGRYYAEISKTAKFQQLKAQLEEQVGLLITEDENYRGNHQLLKAIFQEPLMLATILLLFLTTSFALLDVFIRQSKKIALMEILGYSKTQQVVSLYRLFLLPTGGGLILGSVLMIGYQAIIVQTFKSALTALSFSFIGVLILVSLILILSAIWTAIIHSGKNFYLYVKEKKPTLPLIIASKLFIAIFLMVLPLLGREAYQQYRQNELARSADAQWQSARHVFQTTLQYMGHEPEITRPYEKKIKAFYQNNLKKLALIDATNYDTLSNGQPLYRANTATKLEELISPDGKSIRINETYLKWQPILKEDGKPVTANDVSKSAASVTLLVPTNLRKYQKQITQAYQEYFIYRTYQLASKIYEEKTEKILPKITIIWIKEDQVYFTYNEDIAQKQKNKIKNPIAYVDTGHLDASVYYSDMTQNIFFKANKGKDGYETLSTSIYQANVQDQMQLVISTYDQRAQNIQEKQNQVVYYLCLFLLSTLTLAICFIVFDYSLLERNKKKIALKILLGYTPLQIFVQHFGLTLALDILICTLASLTFAVQFTLPLAGVVLLFGILPLLLKTKILIGGPL